MMSLFSSFDLSLLNMGSMFMIVMIFNLTTKVFTISNNLTPHKLLFHQMERFFISLSSSTSMKMTLNLNIIIMMTLIFLNFNAVLPYNFAYTSQISMTMFLSLLFWLSFILISLSSNFKSFIMHFTPEGAPSYLAPLLFLIEIVSNLIRPITLTIRLSANILAGHLLMILTSELVQNFSISFIFYGMLNLVEMGVAVIQAYIFSTMITLYFLEVK